MWEIRSTSQFKRVVSWISTVAILGGCVVLAMALIFEGDREFRIGSAIVVLVLAAITKRALRNLDAAPLQAARTIEKVLYAFAAMTVISGGYGIWAEPALRSVPGVLLILFNSVIGIGGFVVAHTAIVTAKSFRPEATGKQ